MANFDIIAATTKAYKTSWAERAYLGRLAAVPMFIKIMCYMAAFSFGYQDDYIGLTLFLLPALFAEGWILSHYVRLLFLGHRWPFRPSGDLKVDLPVLRIRARGVMAGILVYVLINMALGVVIAGLSSMVPAEGTDPATLPPATGVIMFAALALSFWGFRFVWLYIPYAINLEWRFFLNNLRGAFSSFPMIGVWILCVMPFFLVAQILGGVIHQSGAAIGQSAAGFLFVLLLVVVDTIKNIVATAGISYGLQEIFTKDKDYKVTK